MSDTNKTLTAIERLCSVFAEFADEDVCVTPYKNVSQCADTACWIEPDGDGRRRGIFPGTDESAEEYLLCLRHRAVSPSDRLYATELLERLLSHGISRGASFDIQIKKESPVKLISDSSDGVFSVKFSASYTERHEWENGVSYYVARVDGPFEPLPYNISRFTERYRRKVREKRHIHEDFTRLELACPVLQYDFTFRTTDVPSPLSTAPNAYCPVLICKCYPSGAAYLAEYVPVNVEITGDTVSGTLQRSGKSQSGTFDGDTLVFSSENASSDTEVNVK